MPKTSSRTEATPLATAAKALPPASYEAALQELESLIAQVESGQLPLAELASGYQRGAQLLAFCRSQLDAVEDQIKQLDDGQIKSWVGAS